MGACSSLVQLHEPVEGRIDSRPQVSIIIPVFNGERYLEQAIRSAVSQTIRDIEIVIVDNASDDATQEISRSFSDPRIIYFRQDRNVGMVNNWNTGVSISKGSRFSILCADDYLENNFLEKSLISGGSRKLTFTNCFVHQEDSIQRYDNPFREKFHPTARDLLQKLHGIPLSSVIFPRGGIDRFFDPGLPFNCDLELIYRLLVLQCFSLSYIPEELVHVRIHEANETKQYDAHSEARKALLKFLGYTRSPFLLFLICAKLLTI